MVAHELWKANLLNKNYELHTIYWQYRRIAMYFKIY